MWLPPRVGRAEAAFATAVVGGAALAARPNRPAPAPAPARTSTPRDPEKSQRPVHASHTDVFLSDAWAALRRAVMAAVTLFEDATHTFEARQEGTDASCSYNDIGDVQDAGFEQRRGRTSQVGDVVETGASTPASSASESVGSKEEDESITSLCDFGFDFPFDDATSGLALACAGKRRYSAAAMRQRSKLVEGIPMQSTQKVDKAQDLDVQLQNSSIQNETSDDLLEQNTALAERLSILRSQFHVIFEQNGGADCESRIKNIGDDLLRDLSDSVDSDNRIAAELADAKLLLDGVLRRLDATANAAVSENHSAYVDAAVAANAVIDEAKENGKSSAEKRADLVEDDSRLLAVFATKVCASTLHCLEKDHDCAPWSDRVEEIAQIATVGITQVRAVSRSFGQAISKPSASVKNGRFLEDIHDSWPVEIRILNEVAIDHVLRCVALAIAALQSEVIKRAYH